MENIEKKNAISELMESTIQKVKNMVDTNTIVAEPIVAGGITLIPISRLSFGFGSGGSEFGNSKNFAGGGGAGGSIEPVAFLIVQDNSVRVMPVAIPAVNTVDRIVEMAPDIINKVTSLIEKKTEEKNFKDEF